MFCLGLVPLHKCAPDTLKSPKTWDIPETPRRNPLFVYGRLTHCLTAKKRPHCGRLRPTVFLLLPFLVHGKGSKSTEVCHCYTRRRSRPHSLISALLRTFSHKRLTFAVISERGMHSPSPTESHTAAYEGRQGQFVHSTDTADFAPKKLRIQSPRFSLCKQPQTIWCDGLRLSVFFNLCVSRRGAGYLRV